MKHLPLIIAALALSVPVLHAKVYNITLTNADTFTQCQIKYRGSTTKFTGTNKKGEVVTMEVPSTRVLNVREVEEEKPEPKEEPAPAPAAEAEAPATSGEDSKADGEGAGAEEGQAGDAPAAEEQPAEAPAASEQQPQDDRQVQNASLRLRDRLAHVDNEFAGVRSPSRSLTRRVESTRKRISDSLDKLDKQALTVADLQQQFNQAGKGDFTFELVSAEQRSQYERDGAAAYKAMVIDMKEKPGARKVGGLDKFEIMRERYQGIPEYKQAYEWYIRTLKSLDKKWSKMLANEKKRREKLQSAKDAAMKKADTQEFNELKASFEKEGEDIAAVWFNPRPRNLQMLTLACNKVTDALRRNEGAELDETVGTVPTLLAKFWEAMDESRRLMVDGRLDQAEDVLKNDPSYDLLRRIRSNIFPSDYREPIMAQRKKLEDEIQKRRRNARTVKTRLEREASALERAAGSAEAQIGALLEEIQREKDLDAGENTVAMEHSMTEPEEESAESTEGKDGEAPAEAPAEEAPAPEVPAE